MDEEFKNINQGNHKGTSYGAVQGNNCLKKMISRFFKRNSNVSKMVVVFRNKENVLKDETKAIKRKEYSLGNLFVVFRKRKDR